MNTTTTPTVINVSAESITGKENDNVTPPEVKDYDSTLGRYTALSTFNIRKKHHQRTQKLPSISKLAAVELQNLGQITGMQLL
ncbi:hypothetical protein JTE90_024766 [Oedothorax gibbosus]|uniref:Uncharacterized protein n=1 Tax=Oedothorax gibbosus TaxID=931172 RepID=A0AAV6UBB9_9ARAC|nr:hypothetical protein JTE90_024766 [Oedothorax gibbosus]